MAPQAYQFMIDVGPSQGETFLLEKNEIYIGRDITNDVVVSDPEVSRKHARLIRQPEGYMIEDLGSTNGTYIDGERIIGLNPLQPGMAVTMGGNVCLLFQVSDYPSDVPAARSAVPRPLAATPPTPGQDQTIISTQMPPSPVAQTAPLQEPKRRGARIWLLAGCGCVIIFLCVTITMVYAFDYFNLYCTPPFDAFFNSFDFCG